MIAFVSSSCGETQVSGGNPPARLGDHMAIAHVTPGIVPGSQQWEVSNFTTAPVRHCPSQYIFSIWTVWESKVCSQQTGMHVLPGINIPWTENGPKCNLNSWTKQKHKNVCIPYPYNNSHWKPALVEICGSTSRNCLQWYCKKHDCIKHHHSVL